MTRKGGRAGGKAGDDRKAQAAADRKAAAARKAQRERDEQLLRDQQADLDKIRREAGISERDWWGRSR